MEENHNNIPSLNTKFRESGGGFAGKEVGFGVGIRFSGGADDQTWAVGNLGEFLEAVTVKREMVGDRNVG